MSQASIKSSSSRRASRLKSSSKTSRSSNAKVSTITEEASIYHALLVKEKQSIKALEDAENSNSSGNNLTLSTESTLDTTKSFSEVSGSKLSSNPSCTSNCPCLWRITFQNGNIYEGQTNELVMEGKGAFYWTDSSVYEGDFKDGYPCGQGILTLPDLSCYKGDFCFGFLHGHGSLNVKGTTLLYCGEWQLSNRNGKGWLHYDQENVYEGEWSNNRKHGNGTRRYKNHDTYQGEWVQDLINGDGAMMWHNGDYYEGQWCDGYQHGYGEYIWSLTAHDQLVFLNYNWYKGNWVNGFRSGAGIMNFGHESGAKLAGTWMDNLKHGPGVMICGNGVILQKNPLFTDDKPSSYTPLQSKTSNADCTLKEVTALASFVSISKQVLSKAKLATLDDEPLRNINVGSTNIKMKQYIKLLERNTGNAPPLKIPIHHAVHDVDLEYFQENFFKSEEESGDGSSLEIEEIFKTKSESDNAVPPGCANFDISATGNLRNLIINYLPSLRNIYNTYATVCCYDSNVFTVKPVLIRLFLWQLYRDIGVTEENGVSIIEVDEMLMKNPKGCLERAHDPWEPIYFWQFIQAMVGLACLLSTKRNRADCNTSGKGSMYFMFKNFLDLRLISRLGLFQGNGLNYLKDLVPIGSVYDLYRELGEPHTVETFLKNSCIKRGQNLPCYKLLNCQAVTSIQMGKNVTTLNNQLSFLEEDSIRSQNRRVIKPEGLFTFTSLGRKKILSSIVKICPQVVGNLQYQLSFLEFYEIILLLAYRKTEQDRTALLDEAVPHAKSQSRWLSRTSELLGVKRKNKLKK